MITIFAGEDTYRSHEAFTEACARLRASHALHMFRDDALDPDRIARTLVGQTLFGMPSAAALVDATALTGDRADVLVHVLTKASADAPVVVWERRAPDERSKVWKYLKAHGEVSSFPFLPLDTLHAWIRDRVTAQGGTISAAAMNALTRACGANLWALSQEVDKLCLAVQGREITPADVEMLTPMTPDADVFSTVRALAAGDGKTALRDFAIHRQRGNDPRLLLALTLKELRVLYVIRDLLDRKVSISPGELARDFRMPPFAVSALVQTARRTSTARMKSLYDRLIVSLYALNTGRVEEDDVLDMVAFQAIVD